ncbi:FG-GAP-like repeat-containing protein [Rhodohalobacter sp. 8-1]|uniref:FG-GAP-like repeat-containing protein n=1 Tax=Rhodohalobacter sp. 8-1 TaxID=3131972 RepID=UPI0030ED7A03
MVIVSDIGDSVVGMAYRDCRPGNCARGLSFMHVIFLCFLLTGCSSRKQVELQWNQEDGYRWAEIDTGRSDEPGFNRVNASETGINFSNHISKEDIARNHHYLNGSGVATADVDGDGRMDLYLAQLDGPNRLYKNLGGFSFKEITDSAGVAHEGYYSAGVVFADVDNDSDPDLLISSYHKGISLYLNNGQGQFEMSAQNSFNTTQKKGNTTLALADIDGDGDLDLYVTNYRERSVDDVMQLDELKWENTINKESSPSGDEYTLIPPFDDYYTLIPHGEEGKRPARQEIGEKDQLFINDGSGGFTEVNNLDNHFLDSQGNPAGLRRDWGLAAKFQDLNDDGLPDLFVANDFWTRDRIWINQGEGVFKAADPNMVSNLSFSSMAVDFSDINRDGAVDFFVTEMLSKVHERRLRQQTSEPFPGIRFDADRDPQYNRNSMYLNRGDNTFAEIAYFSGLEASEWSWATRFLDVDLDGYEDLLITTGFAYDVLDLDTQQAMNRRYSETGEQSMGHIINYPSLELPNQAFRNNGDLTFSEKSGEWGFGGLDISHGMAVADFDQDGDLDVVLNRLNDTATVFENRSDAPRIAIRLVSSPENRSIIGSTLKLTGGPVTQKKQITAGGDYLSGSEEMIAFAADLFNPDHKLMINWPNGKRTSIDSLRANRIYEIQDPQTVETEYPSTSPMESLFQDISASIDHTHQESSFDDFQIQPLLPYHLSRLGPGLSWIDYDRDGDDDLFIAAGRGQPIGIYQNDGSGNFEPVTLGNISRQAPGDQTMVLGWEAAGGTQLMVGSANYEQGSEQVPSAYGYTIEGEQTLADGLEGVYSTTGPMAAADYDADGDLDLFVGGRFIPGRYPQNANSRMFTNNDGSFQLDKENSKVLEEIGLVTSAVFSDYDLDGDPDLIVATEWGSIKLFQNQQGNFRDVTQSAGLEQYKGWWNGIATGDFNNDGLPDIVATNIGKNSPYQLNTGQPLKMFYQDFNNDSRVDIIEAYHHPQKDSYVPRRRPFAFGSIGETMLKNVYSYRDFANATLQDLLWTDTENIPSKELNRVEQMVFMNEGGTFSGYPLPAEAQFSAAFSVNVADYDNDGKEDLFLSQNLFSVRPLLPRFDAGRGLWLRGDGNGGFTAIPGHISGINIYGEQRGAALADIDMDGRVDLAVGQNDGPTRLFVNRTESPGLRVRLIGPPENRNAFGSSLRLVYVDGQKGPRREIQAGSGYWSQNSASQVMGRAQNVAAIEVFWFDGTKQNIDVKDGQLNYVIGQ